MPERIRITKDQIITRDAGGNVVFDSNALYVKKNQSTAKIFAGGYGKVPMSFSGGFSSPEVAPYQGGYVVHSSSLFFDSPQTIERWVPRFNGAQVPTQNYFKFITPIRYLYTNATTSGDMLLSGMGAIAHVQWRGVIGQNLNGDYVIRLSPQFTWMYAEARAGYLTLPFTFAQNFYYTDNGALYMGEYGAISTAKFSFDFLLDCTPRPYYYGTTT